MMRRATRTVARSPLGTDLAAFLERPEVVKKMIEAANHGVPPVTSVSGELLSEFPHIVDDAMAKRRIGMLIAAVLDQHGFVPVRSNVRIKDPIFVTGSTYTAKREK